MEFRVNIYIETSFHGPSRRTMAAGIYVIEYIMRDGTEVTRQGIVCCKEVLENALALEALVLALERLDKTCSIRVNTECDHILYTIGNNWLSQWEKNEWRNAKNKPIKNKEFWEKIAGAQRKHMITVQKEKNKYQTLMADAMKKCLKIFEKDGDDKAIYRFDFENMVFDKQVAKEDK